ncbi:hypothetical protein EV378_3067 [Pseudonocardia endophytica]|uniref:Uncharacterized protein n=1 Tax=Pseudonocardia endophytica TaxID=401976 RepID=A0A4R1I1T1_PSEEN|nr:hypothetical protein EV378_3067 [Pseudonocardia endophytica]
MSSRAAWAVARLVLLLGCFALAAYAVDLLLLGDPSLFWVAVWFAGALFLHDLVLFPLYAGGDRILTLVLRALPSTRVPLVNHIRIPVLGAGLSLLMFLPGIVRQGTATSLAAAGLDQEPYRERWVWLTVALFAVSAVVWGIRTLVSPGHDEQAVDGDREDGLDGQPSADLPAGNHPAREDDPDAER